MSYSWTNEIYWWAVFFLFLILFPIAYLTFKGFIKALVATLLNDQTPKKNGFLSLNPMKHCNLIYAALIPAFGYLIFFFLGCFFMAIFPGLIVVFYYPANFPYMCFFLESIVLLSLLMLLIFLEKMSLHPMPFDKQSPNYLRNIIIINLANILGSALFFAMILLALNFEWIYWNILL